MEKSRLEEIKSRWLAQCGACDAGLSWNCTCAAGDFRPDMLALVEAQEAQGQTISVEELEEATRLMNEASRRLLKARDQLAFIDDHDRHLREDVAAGCQACVRKVMKIGVEAGIDTAFEFLEGKLREGGHVEAAEFVRTGGKPGGKA